MGFVKSFSSALFIGGLSVSALFQAAYAAPAIKSVSNGPGGSSELIIEGSGFSTKKRAAPLAWYDFENGYARASQLSTSETPSINGTIQKKANNGSNYSVACDVSISYATCGPQEIYFESDSLYVFVERYYDFSIADPNTWGNMGFNLKTFRLWAGHGPDTKNNIYMGYQGKEGANSARVYPEYTGTQPSVRPRVNGEQVGKKWLQDEFVYKAGSVGVDNGVLKYIRDGYTVFDEKFTMRDSSYPNRYRKLVLDQVSNGTGRGPLNIYYDNIYVDDSLHRAFVSESPTLSKVTKKHMLIPTEWTGNRVKVTMPSGVTQSGKLYLYISDKDGQINSTGYPLCTSCPVAPVLKVSN